MDKLVDKLSLKSMYFVSFIVIIISLYFSIEFFLKISVFFAVMIVIIELTKAIYITKIKQTNNIVIKSIMIIICISATIFSILGVVANGYNFIQENKKEQQKTIKNKAYDTYLKDKDSKSKILDSYRRELVNYPNFETYINTIPKWERTENLTLQYNADKKQIMDKIDNKQKEIDALKEPTQTLTIKNKVTGYNALFTQISKIIHVEVDNLILILVIFIAVLMEMIVYSSLLVGKSEKKILGQNEKILGQNLKRHSFRIRKIIPRTSTKINVLETKNIPRTLKKADILEKKENVLENIPEVKKEIHRTNEDENVLEKIKIYLRKNFVLGDLINKFQDKFELTEYDYKKIRDQLVKEGIIDTKNRRMYYKGNLRAVK